MAISFAPNISVHPISLSTLQAVTEPIQMQGVARYLPRACLMGRIMYFIVKTLWGSLMLKSSLNGLKTAMKTLSNQRIEVNDNVSNAPYERK